MNIRRVKSKDLDQLMVLERQSFYPQEVTTEEIFEFRIQTFPQWCFVAEEEGKIYGMILCRLCQGDLVNNALFMKNKIPESGTLAILALAVPESERGKGYATRLLDHIIQLARQRGIGKLIVACEDKAIGFFQRFGFQTNGMVNSRTTKPYHNLLLKIK